MLERLLDLERGLFFALNACHSSFWDNFMWLYSYKFTWTPFYICFFIVFVYKKQWKEMLLIIFCVALLVLLCDQISSGFFKPYFQRFRPTHHPDFMNEVITVFDYRGGRYGFISGHAANSFGFAVFTALIFRNPVFSFMIFCFALLTAYSRVYLGVHFISDIVTGAAVGALIGYIVYRAYVFGRKKFLKIDKRKIYRSAYSFPQSNLLVLIYMVMLLILLLFNKQVVSVIL